MEQLMLKGRNHLAIKKQCAQPLPLLPPMFIQVPDVTALMVASEGEQALNMSKTESSGLKRSADLPLESFYPALYCKRPAMESVQYPFSPFPPLFDFPAPAERKFPYED
jgi:hypothetical protein